MFRPHKVYLDNQDISLLKFDSINDIQPLTDMSPPVLNNEAQAMNVSIGGSFQVDQFLNANYRDKKSTHKARAFLIYLTQNIDDSILRFGSNGGIFYKGNLVPEGDLGKVLQNITNKKSKTLVHGEYYMLSCLTGAPPSILNLINPSKLKMCNLQLDYKTKGPPMAQSVPQAKPKKIPLPPGSLGNEQIVIKTANPFTFKPQGTSKPHPILKTPTTVSKQKPPVSNVQKKFNAKPAPAWYKIL